MTNETIMLTSFFVTLILIGATSTAAMMFGRSPSGDHYKKATRYFALAIGLPSLFGSIFLILPLEVDWQNTLRNIISGAIYLSAAHCFRAGYCYRSGHPNIKLSSYIIHLILYSCVVAAFSTDQLIANDPLIRITFIELNYILLSLTMFPIVKREKNKPASFGERANYVAIVVSILMFSCYPVALFFSESKFEYLAYGLPLQVLQIHVWVISLLILQLSDVIDIYRKQAVTDTMTGLSNRGHFFKASSELLASNISGSLIYCDIDNFKRINDNFGHSGGDAVIIAFSELLQTTSHDDTVTARLGGEEFVMFLPNMPLNETKALADQLRIEAEKLTVVNESATINFTVSFGVAMVAQGNNEQSYEDVLDAALKAADKALYQAKHAGRNTVMTQKMPTIVA